MENNRTYSVYVHKVDTADKGPMYYTGVSHNLKRRWVQDTYKQCSLWPYIDEYGWNNIEHRVVADGLDRETAFKLEDCLICMYRSADCCINKRRSGRIEAENPNKYYKQYKTEHKEDYLLWFEENKEVLRAKKKRYYEEHRIEILKQKKLYAKIKSSTPEWKIYQRVRAYNNYHPDKIIETALEARDKYIQNGYIPDYIKTDDLQ